MKLRVTPRASQHLFEIATYVAMRDKSASVRVGTRIQETFDCIQEFPLLGHKGALPGTKELLVPGMPFVVVYRRGKKHTDTIEVVGIYRCAQRRPGQ